VTLINTDGLALIGPGSEWFWTALQLDEPFRSYPALAFEAKPARTEAG
jgi:hypothetical protein